MIFRSPPPRFQGADEVSEHFVMTLIGLDPLYYDVGEASGTLS